MGKLSEQKSENSLPVYRFFDSRINYFGGIFKFCELAVLYKRLFSRGRNFLQYDKVFSVDISIAVNIFTASSSAYGWNF
jgi:hypothetical protein